MPNGKPGDHPNTDIVVHGKDVYSSGIAKLVREIASLGDEKTRRQLGDMLLFQYNEYATPNIAELEQRLRAQRDELLSNARERGYEIDS